MNTRLTAATPQRAAIKSAVGWALLVLWTLMVLLSHFVPATMQAAAGVQMLATIGFAVVFGAALFGWRGMTLFLVTSFITANVMENLSINTGFPFGFFHHTDVLGPKLFAVPVILGFFYFYFAIVSWAWADLVLGPVGRPTLRDGIARAVVAMIVASAWDACLDPVGATVNAQWIYPAGGGYFGVPLSNSLGWMLTIFTMVALFELWRIRQKAELSIHVAPVSGWRLQIPVLLGLSLLTVVLPWLSQPDRIVTDPAGVAWHAGHIYESTVLVSLHTLLLFAVIGIFICLRHSAKVNANNSSH
jgi:uncharacterized membrane protein